MGDQENNTNVFQTYYNNLQPVYSITSNQDLIDTMIAVGIPEEETSTIARIFDLLGHNCFIDVEGVSGGEGLKIQFHDPGGYATLERDELETEIQILQDEMESAKDESKKYSCLRRIAEISGRLATIKVPFQSEGGLQVKKKNLFAYIRIAREIIERS